MRTLAVLALTACLLTGGCAEVDSTDRAGSTRPGQESSTASDPVPSPQIVLTQPDLNFASYMRVAEPEAFGSLDDESLVVLGRSVCLAFDSGATYDEEVSEGSKAGYGPDAMRTLIFASIELNCIEYQSYRR